MMHRDLYQVLGVPRNATRDEIRTAYIRLARRHHPDGARVTTTLPWRLQEVQQAYRCLSDAQARSRHDRQLDEHAAAHFARQRAVQRRLRRYDHRHPHAVPGAYRRFGWRSLLVVAAGVAIAARVSLRLIG